MWQESFKWKKTLIFSALCLCAILLFISPIWMIFATLGFGIGWILRYGFRKFVTSKRFRLILLITSLSFVCLFIGFYWYFMHMADYLMPAPPPTYEVTYKALVSYSSKTKDWTIQEHILVHKDEWFRILEISKYHYPNKNTDDLERLLKQNLLAYGWRYGGTVRNAERLLKSRTIILNEHWVPAQTLNKIPLEMPLSIEIKKEDMKLFWIFEPDNDSELTLHAPKYLIGNTFPPYSMRSDMLEGGSESLIIPIKYYSGEQAEVRLEVLSPLLRWRFGPDIRKITLWSGVKWFFLAICLVFSEQIKENVIRPFVAPLFSRRVENNIQSEDS